MVPNVPLTYLELDYAPRWQLRINAFRIGEKPTFNNGAKSAFFFDEKVAVLDTFSPYIKLPSSIATQVYAKIFHEIDDIAQQGDLLMGSCDITKYSSLNLFINDRYYMKLMPESFVIDIGVRGRCLIPFQFNDEDEFVLGEPFFRNFYSIFDDSKGVLAVAPSVNFVHSSIFEGMVPDNELVHPIHETKEARAERQKSIPSMSDPVGVAEFLGKEAEKVLEHQFGAKLGSSPFGKIDFTQILEYLGIAVALGVTLCCCCSVALYFAFQYFISAPPA
jgi:hypothetical protein